MNPLSMGIVIRKTVCFLCAIICACSLAFAEQKTMQFLPTGKNSFQNGATQILFTRLGTLLTFTTGFVPFAAYNPEKLPDGTLKVFLEFKDGKFGALNLGDRIFSLKDLAILKLSNGIKVKINKALAFVLLADETLVIFTNGKFLAHIVNKELIGIFFSSEELKKFGFYSIGDDAVKLADKTVTNNSSIGVGSKNGDSLACVDKTIIFDDELSKIKGNPAQAKKTLETVLQQQQERQWRNEAMFWINPTIALDLATLQLVKLKTDNKFCILTAEKLN